MNETHNIEDLDLLYSDAKKLMNDIISKQIDEIILKSIDDAINNLEENWRGQDANLQINNLIDIKNTIIDNRDIIGNIGVFISILAKNYRDAQNSNEMILPSFSQLNYTKIEKYQKRTDISSQIYMNNNITETIPILNSSISSINETDNLVITIKDSIFANWTQQDENRNYALKMFEDFSENIKNIISQIRKIINYIETSINTYNKTLDIKDNMPSLESMFNNKEKEYTIEEKKVLNSIERNFNNNKELNTNFNNTLANEVKKDLVSKGIIK